MARKPAQQGACNNFSQVILGWQSWWWDPGALTQPSLPTQGQDKTPSPSQFSFWDPYRGHPPVCNSMCRMSTRLCAVAKAHSVHLWIFSLACILPTWS